MKEEDSQGRATGNRQLDSFGPGRCPGLRAWGHQGPETGKYSQPLEQNAVCFAECELASDTSSVFSIPSSPFATGASGPKPSHHFLSEPEYLFSRFRRLMDEKDLPAPARQDGP